MHNSVGIWNQSYEVDTREKESEKKKKQKKDGTSVCDLSGAAKIFHVPLTSRRKQRKLKTQNAMQHYLSECHGKDISTRGAGEDIVWETTPDLFGFLLNLSGR